MRRHVQRFIWQLAAVAVLMGVAAGSTASAAGGANGLRVSPVRNEVTIKPGESKTIYVTITNVTKAPADLQSVINDFTASNDESGNPAIILDPNQFASSHSLKRYADGGGEFTLAPGASKDVPITISIPKNAPAGGYYGAVRFAPAGSGSVAGQQVSLASSVGSLVLVKVPGDVTEQVSIASFDVRSGERSSTLFFSGKKLTALVRIQNEGNIQEAPFGKILLKHNGKILESYEINDVDVPGNVLPNSIRRFPVQLKDIKGMGSYTLVGNLGYGASGQTLTAKTTFYIIPLNLVIAILIGILLLAFCIFVLPKMIRAYNRRVLRKAGRR